MNAPNYLQAQDVAAVLRITPSALSNWKRREKMDRLPAPAAYVGTKPLWTAAQIRALLDEDYAASVALLETLDGRNA